MIRNDREQPGAEMDEAFLKKFEVSIDPEEPVFIISVVAEIVEIPIWTLRKLDEMGLVMPKRIGKKTRCYSTTQIRVLNYIHYLMFEKNVNISGIKFILEQADNE